MGGFISCATVVATPKGELSTVKVVSIEFVPPQQLLCWTWLDDISMTIHCCCGHTADFPPVPSPPLIDIIPATTTHSSTLAPEQIVPGTWY